MPKIPKKLIENATNKLLYVLGRRGSGKTTAMMKGAQAYGSRCAVVVLIGPQARHLKARYPGDYTIVSLADVERGFLNGWGGPVLMDADVIQALFELEAEARRDLGARLENALGVKILKNKA